MKDNRKEIGKFGERLVADHLRSRKYKILETNFRCPQGEIDIIAREKDCLVFVEVRTKTGTAFGTPEDSITSGKKDKLVSSALAYLQRHRLDTGPWRIDVVAVELGRDGKVARMNHIESAIERSA